MSRSELRHESLEDHKSIIKYIKAIREGFSHKNAIFEDKECRIILKPQGLIKLAVKARKKNSEVKLSLKLEWDSQNDDSSSNTLIIQSDKRK